MIVMVAPNRLLIRSVKQNACRGDQNTCENYPRQGRNDRTGNGRQIGFSVFSWHVVRPRWCGSPLRDRWGRRRRYGPTGRITETGGKTATVSTDRSCSESDSAWPTLFRWLRASPRLPQDL